MPKLHPTGATGRVGFVTIVAPTPGLGLAAARVLTNALDELVYLR